MERDFLSKDINAIVVANYHKNIAYFKELHPSLFEKLSAYETTLDNGSALQRYELSYEAGGFDIFDTQSNTFMYLQQSDKIRKVIQESVNFKKNENVFETFKIVDAPPPAHRNILNLYTRYSNKEQNMKKIEKFIFFGTGLHIEDIHTKIRAKFYYIVEDSLELFRLSLFTTPYYEIAKVATLTFAVDSKQKEFQTLSQKFLDDAFYSNHFIKFFSALHHTETKLKAMHTLIVSQSHLNFFYSSMLEQYSRSLYYLHHNYNFLNLLDTQLHAFLRVKPTLLIAPGPSLGKNIEWLKENQQKFLLVALSATLPILYDAEIKPDIITHFDGFERSAVHFKKVENLSFFDDALLLFSTKTPQSIVNLFDKKQLFFFESNTEFKKNFGSISAFCAGSSSFLILIALKIERIYLLGLDLAVEQKTLQTHTQNYHYNQTEMMQSDDLLDFRNSLIERKGNFQERVKTTPNFTISIDAINAIATGLKEKQQYVYNLNEGAYFQNTIPLKVEEVQLPNIEKANLLNTFFLASQDRLQKEEYEFLEEMIAYTVEVLQIITDYKTKKIDTHKELLAQLIDLENTICLCQQKPCELLSMIIENYAHFIYSFIFDLYNTQEINLTDKVNFIYKNILKSVEEITLKLQTHLKG